MPMLKLPKDLLADPRSDAILRLITTDAAPLWEKGTAVVPTLPWTAALTHECKEALSGGLLVQGLEAIEKVLAGEQKGLDAVRDKNPSASPGVRVSRLLLLANDGSERFYRDCDVILARYGERILGCRFSISGEALGEALFGQGKLARAALIADRKAVTKVLLALLP